MPLFQSKSKFKNLSENEFDLHENEPVGGTHFHMNGFALRLMEAKGNSEMVYCNILF